MNKQHLEPAASIISKIGVSEVVRITGKHESRVYRWRLSKEKGGTGGCIPFEDAEKLLSESSAISPSDFFPSQLEALSNE